MGGRMNDAPVRAEVSLHIVWKEFLMYITTVMGGLSWVHVRNGRRGCKYHSWMVGRSLYLQVHRQEGRNCALCKVEREECRSFHRSQLEGGIALLFRMGRSNKIAIPHLWWWYINIKWELIEENPIQAKTRLCKGSEKQQSLILPPSTGIKQ